jgi:hypothetical protein
MAAKSHTCLNSQKSEEPSWWVKDAQGIPLVRVCQYCEYAKLEFFRSKILTGYNQSDVNEPIEPD